MFISNFYSILKINSIFRTGKNYCPQVFVEECKHVVKEKKILMYFIDNVETSSDSDGEYFDEEKSSAEDSD